MSNLFNTTQIQIRDLKATFNNWNPNTGLLDTIFGSDGLPTYIFQAYDIDFSDDFTSNFNQQSVYGRMDPISTFQNTQRTISLSFTCPASSESEAGYYLNSISALIRSMYPNYSNTKENNGNSSIISAPPLFGIRFGNLIKGQNEGSMLKGVITALSFNPIFDEGVFVLVGNEIEGRSTGSMLYPKTIEINLTFNPLHDFSMGFDERGNVYDEFKDFPYAGAEPEGAGAGRSLTAQDVIAENPSNFMSVAGPEDLGFEDPEARMSQMNSSAYDDILGS